jgi:hypothetical protein
LASGILFIGSCLTNIGLFASPIGTAKLFMYLSALVTTVGLILALLHRWKLVKIAIIVGLSLLIFTYVYVYMIFSSRPYNY